MGGTLLLFEPDRAEGCLNCRIPVWRWITYHVVQAGRKDDVQRFLLNFDNLEAKLAATDINALIADYDYLADEEGTCGWFKAKAIGIPTALFNHRQVLFAKCIKTNQLGFLDRANKAARSAAVRMH